MTHANFKLEIRHELRNNVFLKTNMILTNKTSNILVRNRNATYKVVTSVTNGS